MFLPSSYMPFVSMSNGLKMHYPRKHTIVTKLSKIMYLFGGDKATDKNSREEKSPAQPHCHLH